MNTEGTRSDPPGERRKPPVPPPAAAPPGTPPPAPPAGSGLEPANPGMSPLPSMPVDGPVASDFTMPAILPPDPVPASDDPGAGESPAPPGCEPAIEIPVCVACARDLKPGATFCSRCGHRVGEPAPVRRRTESFTVMKSRLQREWSELQFVITFYVLLLGIQALTHMVAAAGHDSFSTMVVSDILLAALTLVVAGIRRRTIAPLYTSQGCTPRGYGLILAVSLPIFAAVHFYVYGLHAAFHLPMVRYLDEFKGQAIGWPILFICVNAAVFEELAFRGVMFDILAKYVRMSDVFWVSSFAFGILHLDIMTLFTHVPLGLYFCWLRHRSGSLYPSMAAHFLHNAWALADESFHFLPTPGISH